MAWVGPIESRETNSNAINNVIVVTPLANMPVGTLVTLGCCCNLAGQTGFTVTDTRGNTWNVRAAVGAAVLTGFTAWGVLTTQLLAGEQITVTWVGSPSRCSLRMFSWTGQAAAPFDVAAQNNNDTTSPISVGPTAALASTNELAVAFIFWKGGAVTSGYADATAGYTAVPSAGSGGVTTRVETDASYKKTAGTAAETDAPTVTSITAACAELLTFKMLAAVASWQPVTASSRAVRAYAPQRSVVASPLTAAIGLNVAPGAVSRSVDYYRGSPQRAFGSADELLAERVAPVATSRPTSYYRGSYSAISGAADEAIPPDVWTALFQGRKQDYYRGPPARTISAFTPNQRFDPWAQVTVSRSVDYYRGGFQRVFAAADELLADKWTAVFASRRPPRYYQGSPSFVGGVYLFVPGSFVPTTYSRPVSFRSVPSVVVLPTGGLIIITTGGGGALLPFREPPWLDPFHDPFYDPFEDESVVFRDPFGENPLRDPFPREPQKGER